MSNKKYDVSELIHGFDFTEKVKWNGIEFSVRELLPLEDMIGFVDYVTEMCFSDEGEYHPELSGFAIRQCIVRMYSDISLPEDVNNRYSLLYGTNLVDTILQIVNPEQIRNITHAIDTRLKHMAQSNIEMVNAQINTIVKEVEELISKMDNIFAGVSADDISSIIKQIASGELGKNEILKRLIDANVGE